MNPNRVYKFIGDVGHGWLEVPIDDILFLDLGDKISRYSYFKAVPDFDRCLVYLEEDCDMTLFVKAFQDKYNGQHPSIKETYFEGNSTIRYYRHYYGGVALFYKG